MRTRTEIQLMNLRQKYKDYLDFLRSQPVIQISEYRKIYVRFHACDQSLMIYRAERQNIA